MIMITDNVTMMLGFRIRIQIECIRTHKVTALKKPWLLVRLGFRCPPPPSAHAPEFIRITFNFLKIF